jgi:hypothetical protein
MGVTKMASHKRRLVMDALESRALLSTIVAKPPAQVEILAMKAPIKGTIAGTFVVEQFGPSFTGSGSVKPLGGVGVSGSLSGNLNSTQPLNGSLTLTGSTGSVTLALSVKPPKHIKHSLPNVHIGTTSGTGAFSNYTNMVHASGVATIKLIFASDGMSGSFSTKLNLK